MTNDFGFNPDSVQLGKEPARIDPRTLQLADFIDYSALPVHPSTNRYSDLVPAWGMLGNDRKGNCVLVGDVHQEMLFSAAAGTPWLGNEQQCIDTYNQLTGGADSGLVILDYLKWRRKNAGASPRKVLGFAAVNWRDQQLIEVASWMFYGVLRGIWLPNTAKAQTGPGGLWDVVTLTGDGTHGSWGGHLTLEPDYDPSRFGDVTWGFVQPASRSFMNAYCDECYVVIPNYPVPGFDYPKFVDSLKQIGSNVDVDPVPDPPIPPPAPADDINSIIRDKLGYWTGVDFTFSKGAKWHADVVPPPGA